MRRTTPSSNFAIPSDNLRNSQAAVVSRACLYSIFCNADVLAASPEFPHAAKQCPLILHKIKGRALMARFVLCSDAAFKLRDAVTSQTDARVVVLDLTEMETIGGGVIGMLVF